MKPKSIRRLSVWLLGAAAIGVGLCLVVFRTSPSKTEPPLGEIKECRVHLECGSFAKTVEVTISDQEIIDRAVREPIRVATVDPEPARYVIIGSIEVAFQDGSREFIHLYRPWGHFKRGEKYMITDFSELKRELGLAIEGAQRVLER